MIIHKENVMNSMIRTQNPQFEKAKMFYTNSNPYKEYFSWKKSYGFILFFNVLKEINS